MAKRTLISYIDLLKIERPQIKGHKDFPRLILNRIVNDAYKYIQIQLAHLGIKQWEATDVLTLSSGTLASQSVKTADLSTDCPNRLFENNDVIKYIETTGVTYNGIATFIEDSDFVNMLRNPYKSPTEYEPKFTRKNNLILISPSTITAGTAVYYKTVTDLSADADATTVPENYEDFIIKKALIDIDAILENIQVKEEVMNELNNNIQKTFQAFEFIKVETPKEIELK